jgi:hypothetical protein
VKNYHCNCGHLIFFESHACVRCQRALGFLPDFKCVSSLEPAENDLYVVADQPFEPRYRKCRNYSADDFCNWMIPEAELAEFCVSCRLDEIIPDVSIEKNRDLWRLIEKAKRRLIYTLISLSLPLQTKSEDPENGLSFRFLEDGPTPDTMVQTGHSKGLITLNIAEADDSERERRRLSMKEPYRTLLGHFRHESGHYYWDRLIADTPHLETFRTLFGDERVDYDSSLQKYYATGALANWQDSFISAYATAHAWEDWAESWAHYLHIQDTLEVALAFGLVDRQSILDHEPPADQLDAVVKPKTFEEKILAWAQLSIALNGINRSMGLGDIYPFVLSPTVVAKLHFIAEVIGDRASFHAPPQTAH